MSRSLVEITADLLASVLAAENRPEEDVVALYKRLYQAVRESHEDEARLRKELDDVTRPAAATGVSPLPGFPPLPFPFPFPNFSAMTNWTPDGKPPGT